MDVKGNATNTSNSDFENIKAWENNTNLDYYLSEEHWNFHVNQILYKNLLVFYEGKEVGAFLDVKEPDFGNPIKDYTSLYGNMFNEAYSLCKSILTIPVPETKVAQFANQSATWKFRNLKDKKGKPIKFEIAPNVTDLIESYHILGMVNAILCFANDQSASVDRFMIALSVYKDKGLPFCGNIHCFEPYNEVYQKIIFATVVDGSYLRTGFDYKKRDEYLRENLSWYNNIAKEYEKNAKEVKEESTQGDANRTNMAESVIDKISANNIRYYYDGWRNGKHGSICQSNGIYRFFEMTRGKTGMLDDVNRKEEDNPIVAKGIVAYWLQFNSRMDTVIKRLTKYNCEIPKDIREQFANYTQIRFEQFRQEHRDDPNTWDWDWEYEFYVNTIIPHEIAFNKESEALFDYISDSDIELVRGVMNSYIKYLKKIRTEKGYQVNPELLVLRAIDSGDETKQEDLEEFEVNTILEDLERKGCIKVCWILGHKPWTIALLDRGRAYLKQLEEGGAGVEIKPVVETKPVVTTQQPPKEHKAEISPQTPKMPLAHKKSSHIHLIEDEEWDDTFDYIFNEKVKPQEIMRALVGIVRPKKISEVRFYYVSCRILEILNYLTEDALRTDFMRWINIHFKCGWPDDKEHKRRFSFALEGSSKNLENQHPSQWDENTIKGGSGIYHHQLAIKIKNAFTQTIINGEAIDDSNSFDHLIDRGQYLRFATHLRDNDYYIPEEAYINNGK